MFMGEPGGYPSTQPVNRYFFAIVPEAGPARAIDGITADLRQSNGLRGTIIDPSRYHISLCGVGGPGEAPHDVLSKLIAVGDQVRYRPFDVGFDHAISFSQGARKRSLVLAHSETMPALNWFQAGLRRAMAAVGLAPKRQQPFDPHLTLLYDEQRLLETGIPLLRWTVRDFVLIRSIHGESRHRHLARWALGGGRSGGIA
ncbi:2'-5' RNA ligase family protein [Bosea sp. (in: a-proteobacteria)]|uniref:2'-5' RNA ligase family protein n=1 Tax=Bosea sp. (in: a-proteobacteria) TaxID=1871050 RepID=UPI002FC7F03B